MDYDEFKKHAVQLNESDDYTNVNSEWPDGEMHLIKTQSTSENNQYIGRVSDWTVIVFQPTQDDWHSMGIKSHVHTLIGFETTMNNQKIRQVHSFGGYGQLNPELAFKGIRDAIHENSHLENDK